MLISSKSRAKLRKMANGIDTIFQIGRGGITDAFATQVTQALEARELIKIRVLENSGLSARDACDSICSLTGAHPVQCIGTRFVIYKQSKTNKKIVI